MQGGEEARSEAYLVVRCNDEQRSQHRRWAFFISLLGSLAVEVMDSRRHSLNLLVGKLRETREGEDCLGGSPGVDEGLGRIASGPEDRLRRKRNGIVKRRPDPTRLEMFREPVPLRTSNGELVIDVPGRQPISRDAQREAGQEGGIPGCDSASGPNPSVHMGELHPEERRLKLIEPAVPAQLNVVISVIRPVVPESPNPLREIGSIRHDHPAVAAPPQRFGGVKAQARHVPKDPHPAALIGGPKGLGSIFHEGKTVPTGDGPQGCHLRREPEQMHREDRNGPWSNRPRHLTGVEVEALGINVHEDRPGPHLENRCRRGHKGKGSGNDLIPGPDSEGLKGQLEGIGA